MKKIFIIVLAIILSITMLAACGNSANSGGDTNGGGNSDSSDELTVSTLGEAFAAAAEDGVTEWGSDGSTYVYVFDKDGITYRAIADLTPEIAEELEAIDFMDEERDAKYEAILSDVEVRSIENLSALIPSQEETDKYIGKTGGELFEEGWDYNYYNLDDMEAGLNHGIFGYMVKFDYDGPKMENTDDFDFFEAFKDLKVKEITCTGIQNGTNIEE